MLIATFLYHKKVFNIEKNSRLYTIDAYKNVTKKTFSGYKYITEHCNHDYKWVLYLDDDTLLDETQFEQMINATENTTSEHRTGPYCLAGLKMPKAGVIRPDNCFIF